MTYYKSNKLDTNLNKSYRKGRINAAKWLSELIYYYIQRESNFINEFKEHIQNQKIELRDLEDTHFKQGLFDELNTIEDMLEKIIK